jgi:transporter family protein
MWIILGLISSFFLGVYDVSKKWSLNENAVIPVLFFATLTGMLIFAPFLVVSYLAPGSSVEQFWYIPSQTPTAHLHFFLKAIIVGTSWILAYFALKNLPITIVTPIRASSPIWTLIGAVIIFDEQFTTTQWTGIFITIGFYYLFALIGRKEGIHFTKNPWIYLIILATIIGAGSSLYDKYLIARYDRLAVQAWFSVYLVVYYLPIILFLWYPKRHTTTPFRWRYSILLIAIFLILADFAYFYALSYTDSLVAIIAALRRSSVVVSFILGALIFKDQNLRAKWWVLLGILLGVFLIYWGSN